MCRQQAVCHPLAACNYGKDNEGLRGVSLGSLRHIVKINTYVAVCHPTTSQLTFSEATLS